MDDAEEVLTEMAEMLSDEPFTPEQEQRISAYLDSLDEITDEAEPLRPI